MALRKYPGIKDSLPIFPTNLCLGCPSLYHWCSIFENLNMDIGIKGGLNKPETDLPFLVGVAWRF
jgi:hypothetical protein